MASPLLFLLLAASLSFGFCGASIASPNRTLRVAVVAPLISKSTGSIPTWSTSGLIATLLAIDVINNKTDGIFDDVLPGTNITYEIFDSRQDTSTIALLAPKLLSQAFGGEGADIVLGAGTSGSTIALHSILKFFDMPQVSPSATSGYLSASEDYPYFSRLIPTDGVLTDGMIQFARHVVGWESGAIICGNDAYSIYGGNALRSAAIAHNLLVSAFEIFPSGATDIRKQIDKAVKTGARLFFYFGQSTDVLQFFKAMYASLLNRGDIHEGFSIIYADSISKAFLDSLKQTFLQSNEQHVFETIVNGSYVITLALQSGNVSKIFEKLYTEEIKANVDCFNEPVNKSECSDCLKHRVNPRTGKPIFHLEKRSNAPKVCIAPNGNSGIGYYPQFNFDSVIMIARAYDILIKDEGRPASVSNKEYMALVTSPSFTFEGATGTVKLDKNGDRIQDGISFLVSKVKISQNVDTTEYFYRVGRLSIDGQTRSMKMCTESEGVIFCDPYFTFNSKDNLRPDPIDRSLLRINLGIATSIYHATKPYKIDASGSLRTLAILMAIDEINNQTNTLRKKHFHMTPQIFYEWRNSGRSSAHAAAAGSYFIAGEVFNDGRGADAIIGAFSSGPSMSLQSISKIRQVLQLSPSSTSPALSDKDKYPSFGRTVPSDVLISRVLVKFVKLVLNWQEISLVYSSTPYATAGAAEIERECERLKLSIAAHVLVKAASKDSMVKESMKALKNGNRAFIVFLHTSDILLFSRAMEDVARSLKIDISNICFVFSETGVNIGKGEILPSVLNGSFALKPENGGHLEIQKNMINNMKQLIESNKVCEDSLNKKTTVAMGCKCIKEEWQRIFYVDHDFDISTPKKCAFPSTINLQDYYVPFAYDTVLTVAKLYHNIILKKEVDSISDGFLKNTLFSSTQSVDGATGPIEFDSNGDRKVTNVHFTVLNMYNGLKEINTNITSASYSLDDNELFHQVGTISGNGNFEFCNAESHNGTAETPCVPKFIFSTYDGKQPLSVLKACQQNSNCGDDGICKPTGECQCPPGRTGITCQQKLFPLRTKYENADGSDRCLRFIKPPNAKHLGAESKLTISVRTWTSQALVSEVAAILLKEVMYVFLGRNPLNRFSKRRTTNKIHHYCVKGDIRFTEVEYTIAMLILI